MDLMWNDILVLLKHELILVVTIFVLLFIKVGAGDGWNGTGQGRNGAILNLINILLLANLIAGFFMNTGGELFGRMFHTNPLIVLEKNMLNLGTLLISM